MAIFKIAQDQISKNIEDTHEQTMQRFMAETYGWDDYTTKDTMDEIYNYINALVQRINDLKEQHEYCMRNLGY
jgi:polyhydroxyalkanoate synthesis regulator phasin